MYSKCINVIMNSFNNSLNIKLGYVEEMEKDNPLNCDY